MAVNTILRKNITILGHLPPCYRIGNVLYYISRIYYYGKQA